MTFDPFGDFETRGYLRNFAGYRDPAAIKQFEHEEFLANIDAAFDYLSTVRQLSYADVLATHKTLFGEVYPWAGQDRKELTPDRAVSKGSVMFAHPDDIRPAVDYALKLGQDPRQMAKTPGEVMGYLAYGHPFLDGNGRTIMIVHVELCHRAGISIDWSATNKTDYLVALTREIDDPSKHHLDQYLSRFVGPATDRSEMARQLTEISGLGDSGGRGSIENEVVGNYSDPGVQARYRHQQRTRGEPGKPRDDDKDRGGRGGR